MDHPTFRRPTHSLKDKVAIVTGAGSLGNGLGNGRASSILLAEDGCSVVCVDLDLNLAQTTAELINSEGAGHAIAVQADVSRDIDCQRIVTTTMQTYGRLDILVNCVGILGTAGTVVTVDMARFARDMEVNVFSMVLMAKYAIPEMIKNDDLVGSGSGYRGSIVNMSSISGMRGGASNISYPTTKGTVLEMTKAMAYHHGPEGIRVNCVCPGMVYTPMMYGAGEMTVEQRQARAATGLIKTEGNAWDVGAAVRFLAGEQARWITGIELVVDAGVTSALGSGAPAPVVAAGK